MSNTIRIYQSIFNPYNRTHGDDLSLTATMQGEENGGAIQFTLGNSYCVLSEKQLLDMIKVIKKRINCKPGWSATDCAIEETIMPNGEPQPSANKEKGITAIDKTRLKYTTHVDV